MLARLLWILFAQVAMRLFVVAKITGGSFRDGLSTMMVKFRPLTWDSENVHHGDEHSQNKQPSLLGAFLGFQLSEARVKG